ncbi:UNVERIFIED_CONTAM: hypothetical protein GTU68_050909 [Idotea baltica]|nr:hypothetical protein [Idotea baltica]
MSDLNKEALSRAATEARGLAIDAIHACSSGHLGLPLGAADIGSVLFGDAMRFNPAEPKWLNRDRFILSAGHGSMFIYGWLHLAGYNLSLDEVKNFRQLHSLTPGHPEFDETDGVEATTGPLGQGVGNGVGYAMSAKMAAAKYNTADHTLFDQTIFVLAGDGCLQEGVAAEAIAFAGHFGLDNLVLIYDSNDVTLDAMADVTQSYNACDRFKSFGWDAVQVDGHDLDAVSAAINEAKTNRNGKPTLIEAKTVIGKGRNVWYGIREHAMGAICNGVAYDGVFRVSGATFAVFADYLRPSIRIAGLAGLPVGYILTHDSVGVGEDGPTHQPVETVSGLRVIPNLDVIRPGDPEETAGAFAAMIERKDGPTALFLTRQSVATLNEIPVKTRREGVFQGGYIAKKETGELTTILLATGSELQHAMEAATELGDGVRVVSMPCFERFDRQSQMSYIEVPSSVLMPKPRRESKPESVGSVVVSMSVVAGEVCRIETASASSAPGVHGSWEELGMTLRISQRFVKALADW